MVECLTNADSRSADSVSVTCFSLSWPNRCGVSKEVVGMGGPESGLQTQGGSTVRLILSFLTQVRTQIKYNLHFDIYLN